MSPRTHEAPLADDINRATRRAKAEPLQNGHDANQTNDLPLKVRLEDFVAYMPQATYIFMKTGQMWPASSVNARLQPVSVGTDQNGKEIFIAASKWIAEHQPVEQMTWAPGDPPIIRHRFISDGGWIALEGIRVFNQYRPPTLKLGNPMKAGYWTDLVYRLWPDDAEHLFNYFAHRVQRPFEKINHALVVGGSQGIGKDTILEGIVQAVGPWNVQDIAPSALLADFNGYAKAVILRISEARDLAFNRYQFYEISKNYIAAPPSELRVNEKHLREYYIPNLCSVVFTTNHKTTGLYLPEDDRRHFVTWSVAKREEFSEQFWRDFWAWYQTGGFGHVAAWLSQRDLKAFDPKAPPPQTEAFWAIVDANMAPEDAELADALDRISRPQVVTLEQVAEAVANDAGFTEWLKDRKNRRQIPHRFEQAGYIRVRNAAASDGLWKISGRRQALYGRHDLDHRTRLEAARLLATGSGSR